ncbi:MAG: PrsW family intramembrane metalloprotease [Synechococcales cyanobacterium]
MGMRVLWVYPTGVRLDAAGEEQTKGGCQNGSTLAESLMDAILITPVVLIVPTAFYIWLIQQIDRFEREPLPHLVAAFIWGAIPAVMGSVVLQSLVSMPLSNDLAQGSLLAELVDGSLSPAFTEEILKGLAVGVIAISFRKEFDGWVDGVVYGAMAGFGFAYVENILYLWGTETWEEWWTLLLLRTVVFGGLHGLWTALTGIGFGLARYRQKNWMRVVCVLGGLAAAIAGHSIHNGALTLAGRANSENVQVSFILVALVNYGALIILMGLLWILASWLNHHTLTIYLKDEVPRTLSPELYEGIRSPNSMRLQQLRIVGKQKKALLQVAAELAQKKMQRLKMGEEEGNTSEIRRLRKQLREVILQINPKVGSL